MIVLEVSGLAAGYGRVPVLFDVSLHVGDEIVALLGANGAGKTTLLRALAGQLRAARGSVTLAGRELGRLSPWRRVRAGVAHVPEGRRVFKAMTVADNLAVAGLVSRDSALDEVFTLFPRLAERRSQLAGNLSGGEQQMLAIGRALMTRPRVLLVDELSAGLAPAIVVELVARLMAIRRQGVSVLLVEQSPHYIADAVDRAYVLERGRIVREGTARDVGGRDALAGVYLGGEPQAHRQ